MYTNKNDTIDLIIQLVKIYEKTASRPGQTERTH